MTEDEAKTKWCPFVRMESTVREKDVVFYNNRGRAGDGLKEGVVSLLCIGSACMAWRAMDNEIKANPDGPIEDGKSMRRPDYVSAGYCGLAGK